MRTGIALRNTCMLVTFYLKMFFCSCIGCIIIFDWKHGGGENSAFEEAIRTFLNKKNKLKRGYTIAQLRTWDKIHSLSKFSFNRKSKLGGQDVSPFCLKLCSWVHKGHLLLQTKLTKWDVLAMKVVFSAQCFLSLQEQQSCSSGRLAYAHHFSH